MGICGFLPKDGALGVILDALRHACPGNMIVHPSLVARLGRQAGTGRRNLPPETQATDSERTSPQGGERRRYAPEVIQRREVRMAVTRFLAAGFAALVLVATPVTFWIRDAAEQHALANARDFTQRLADNVVGPLITPRLLARSPLPSRNWTSGWRRGWPTEASPGSRCGMKRQGGLLGRPSLIGQEFEQEEWAHLLLAGGPATATVESQTAEENEFEASSGELVEVYVRPPPRTGRR